MSAHATEGAVLSEAPEPQVPTTVTKVAVELGGEANALLETVP